VRRFQSMIYFGRPKVKLRPLLWKQLCPKGYSIDPRITIPRLAKIDLTGANISNIYKYCVIMHDEESGHIDFENMFTGDMVNPETGEVQKGVKIKPADAREEVFGTPENWTVDKKKIFHHELVMEAIKVELSKENRTL
jgi:hypothetical protein